MQPNCRIHAHLPLYDQFDRIPDSLVLVIFNKVADVRSLGRCSAVAKRFNALVPLVHDVYVKIDRVVTIDGEADDSISLSSRKPGSLFTHFVKLMLFAFLKPFLQLRNENGVNKPLLPQVARHSPAQVLKNFTLVRNLRIELPAGDVGTKDGVLLKWRAEFGCTLQSCVVLGEPKLIRRRICLLRSLRWQLRPILEDHLTINSLVLTDADGQGTLSMGAEQLRECRENPVPKSAASNRTQVPASKMKLTYAPFLELPEGIGMQGATLVVIRPSEDDISMSNNGVNKTEPETFVLGAFDEPLKEAVRELMKLRTCLLEMNEF